MCILSAELGPAEVPTKGLRKAQGYAESMDYDSPGRNEADVAMMRHVRLERARQHDFEK